MAPKVSSKRAARISREKSGNKSREQERTGTSPLRELFLSIAARGKEIPKEERLAIPTDLARNHEHYLYGHPKQPD